MSDCTPHGVVFDIARCSMDDGPGIRTTVFLKGCNLRCAWCHNPESFSPRPEVAFDEMKCSLCGLCAETCPRGAHRIADRAHVFDRALCDACGKCAEACPNGALKLYGARRTVAEVMEIILRDKSYYDASGGGVTLSGGEALLQTGFSVALLKECRAFGVHTAVETNGALPLSVYECALPYVDLFLVDYKLSDENDFARYVGEGFSRVGQTLAYLSDARARVWLRCPIIPGVNDTPTHFDAIRALKNALGVERVEIMAYHDMGKAKWRGLGLSYAFDGLKTVSRAQKDAWQASVDAE